MTAPARLLILNYHQIAHNICEESLFSVYPSVLLSHLKLISKLNIPVVSMNDLGEVKENNFYVALTFDDGYDSDIKIVQPMLSEYGFTAAFFPIVNRIGAKNRLSWSDLNQLSGSIGSHSLSHRNLARLSHSDLHEELYSSKAILEDKTGKNIRLLSLPYGSCSRKVSNMATKVGYDSMLTTGLKINDIKNDRLVLSRWTITAKTSFEEMQDVLLSQGNLPARVRISSGLKQYAKNLLGPAISDKLNRIVQYG